MNRQLMSQCVEGGRIPGELKGTGGGRGKVGSGSFKKAGIIYFVLKYFQNQEPKVVFDVLLTYFEISEPMEKIYSWLRKLKGFFPVTLETLFWWLQGVGACGKRGGVGRQRYRK